MKKLLPKKWLKNQGYKKNANKLRNKLFPPWIRKAHSQHFDFILFNLKSLID